MIRKACALVGIVAVGSWLFFKFESHVRAFWHECTTTVAKQESTEFKIKRAKVMLAELEKKQKKMEFEVAEKRVEVEDLQGRMVETEKRTSALASQIKSKHEEFTQVKTGDRKSAKELEEDLNRRLDEYQRLESSVQLQKDSLKQHQKILQTMEERKDKFVGDLEKLKNELDRAESRLEIAKAEEVFNHYQVNNKDQDETRKIIQDVNKDARIKEHVNKMHVGNVSSNEAPKATPSVTERYKTLFEKNESEATAVDK